MGFVTGNMWWGSLKYRIMLEVRAKVEAQVAIWLRRRFSLKSRVEVCAVYIFHLILYRLSVLPLPKNHRVALIQFLFKLHWKRQNPLVCRQVCSQRPRDGGLGMLDLAERLAYLGRSLRKDTVWGLKVGAPFFA